MNLSIVDIGIVVIYLLLIFYSGTLVTIALGIYWKKSRTAGAYLAFTLGALPPILYLVLSEEFKSKWASQLGWGGFLLALVGIVVGSCLQNVLKPLKAEESGS